VEHRAPPGGDPRRTAPRSHQNLPPGVANNPGSRTKDAAKRRELEMVVLRQRVEFDWRV